MNRNIPESSSSRFSSSITSHTRDDASTRSHVLNDSFYGSPPTMDHGEETDEFPSLQRTPKRPTPNLEDALDSRPGQRSISTPIPVTGRRRQRQGSPSVSSSYRQRPHGEQQWTLFGQLMQTDRLSGDPASERDSATTGSGGRRPSMNRSSLLRLGAARNRSPGGRSIRSNLQVDDGLLTPYLMHSPGQELPDPLQNRRLTEPGSPKPSNEWASSSGLSPRYGRPAETDYNSEDSDSDDDEGSDATPTGFHKEDEGCLARQRRKVRSLIPAVPIVYRNMLKCAIAYFIASLFTFEPHLSALFSGLVSYGNSGDPTERLPLPSGHMVATM